MINQCQFCNKIFKSPPSSKRKYCSMKCSNKGKKGIGNPFFKHGSKHTPEYSAWCNMKSRCYNKNNPHFKYWRDKGIMVCDRWLHSFENFLEDMGERPEGMSIDRIDNSKGYSKDNCRWATNKEQSTNRPTWVNAITFNGETHTMTDWAVKIGIGRKTLYDRFENGWSIEKALTTPKKQHWSRHKAIEATEHYLESRL